MRVLLAFDKFKDALSAHTACRIAADALRVEHPHWELDLCPLTDGGEGFAEVLTEAANGSFETLQVRGPRGTAVEAAFGLVSVNRIPPRALACLGLVRGEAEDRWLAVIGMANASGLELLSVSERDPWRTSTAGTGELIRHAATLGVSGVLLGVGGSATNDLGVGALSVLGFAFRRSTGEVEAWPVPAEWENIERIEGILDPSIPPLWIACDVTNPLLGPLGATAVYGPQKGLRAADFEALENQVTRMAERLCEQVGFPANGVETPGTGAAGGLSFGLMAAAGANLVSGSALVGEWLDLESRISAADLVLTGEGHFDQSSLRGKGPGMIAALAAEKGKSAHVFAGRVSLEIQPPYTVHRINPIDLPLAEALKSAPQRLTDAIRKVFTVD